jgi:hypothetical protein
MTYGSPNFPSDNSKQGGADLDHLRSLHGFPHFVPGTLVDGRGTGGPRSEGHAVTGVISRRLGSVSVGQMTIPVSRANERWRLSERRNGV